MNVSSPRMRKFDWLWAAILLVLVSAIAYLPMIRQFGYYFDDWNLIWGGHTYGPQKFIELYSIDRPFVGIVFAQIYPLLGDSALPWNIAAYLLRLASGLGFLWLVRMLWPRQTLATTLMALLFLIYPGFLRQPNAIQYLAHLIGFSMGVWSIALSIRVTRIRSAPAAAGLALLAAGFGLISFLMMEYFIGLEGVRLVLLWYVTPKATQEKLTARALRVLRRWLPYLVTFSGFLIWRIFFFKSSRVATSVDLITQNYLQAPLYQAVRVISELGKDFFEATLFGWFVPSYQLISSARLRDFGYSLLLASLGVALVVAYALWVRRQQAEPAAEAEEDSTTAHWSRDAIWLGVLATLSTALPIILANRGISFSSSFDRYTLPSTLGVVMLVIGLIFYTRQPGLRLGIPLLLVAISLMTHYNNGIFFSGYWQTQRNFWWQMSWRAPQLQPDTVLIADLPGSYPIEEDYEVWGPANLIYYPQPGPLKITSEVLNTPSALNIKLGVETSRTMRLVEVVRDFANTLVLSMPTTSSCLHVIDSERPELSQNEGALIHFVAPSSHVDRIETGASPQRPPENIFGPEPSHDTWCYYYQKASLARQEGDWEEVVRLGDEA
ncbi:MAG: hypothetical protein GYA59_08635, partial [Chloroflexi bacterium]|nr:hypothetical protein [Chloroflexota bacterium]